MSVLDCSNKWLCSSWEWDWMMLKDKENKNKKEKDWKIIRKNNSLNLLFHKKKIL